MDAPYPADQPRRELPAADLLVAQVMQRWPQTVPVFVRRRMACPGCPAALFETVAEAAAIYGVPADELLADLCRSLDAPG